jgi:RNA polymerase sigma-70 factor, ECF subfamily
MRTEYVDAPDGECVVRAQAGDAAAFAVLFDRYYDMIHAFTYRICFAEIEAEDLAQETFIRAARGIGGYRGTASFKNWLFRIAHHAVVDWQRQQARRRERETAFAAEMETRTEARTPDHSAVHAALRQLPIDWREAVALVYFDEMNHGEAAKVMGCAETTVSWRIFRAKRALKKLLGEHKGDFA